MKENCQGFKYPFVDNKRCINCGLCIDSCSFNDAHLSNNLNEFPQFYGLKHKNQDVRIESRSGGAYTALSDAILNKHGIVYGCELINCKSALHVRASTQAERNRQRGSKYIQSDLEGVLCKIKEDLDAGQYVMFSGTPCQVAAVKSFLERTNTDKLVLIDVLCHGVGSPRFWKDYLESIERKLNSKIIEAVFRNKKDFGWQSHVETVYYDDQKIDSTLYKRMYLSHLAIRKDCEKCPYKNMHRVGDISLGDCWGIKECNPTFFDNTGVSLVLVNTPKGLDVFNAMCDVDCISIENDRILQQPSLRMNWTMPEKYNAFWRYYRVFGFEKTIEKYSEYAESIMYKDEKIPLVKRAFRKCKRIVRKK